MKYPGKYFSLFALGGIRSFAMPENRSGYLRELAAGLLLFAAFGSLYYFNLSFLEPLYVHYDIFEMDSLPFLNIVRDGNYFRSLHPFSKLLHYPVHAVAALCPASFDRVVRLALAAIGGGNVLMAFLVLRAFLRDPRGAVLFAAAFGFLFSNLVFFSVPETYLLSDSLVLIYALFLVRFKDNMTTARYLVLSALAGLGASNNLPLATLMVPHSYILWKERKSLLRTVVPAMKGIAVMSLVFLAINGVFLNRDFFATLFIYKKLWGSVSHFASLPHVFRVIGTFFLSSVIAPCTSLSSNVYGLVSYFERFDKTLLLGSYGFCLYAAVSRLARNRDRVIDGLLLWVVTMTLAYIYFSPRACFLYSSQVLLPLCMAFARTFELTRARIKYAVAAVFIGVMAYNNLLCLYHPCEVNSLALRQPVMGRAFIGSRVKAFRESAGMTVRQLAGKTGISAITLEACEKGETEMRVYDLENIALALGQPLAGLCSGIPEPK